MKTVNLSDPEFDRIAGLMPDCCIVQIQKVLEEKQGFDKRFQELNKPLIKEMFHGTKSYYVKSILEQGLKSANNRVSAYGIGTYFSPDVKVSLNGYTDKGSASELSYVFLCDVIVKDTGGNKSTIYVCPRDDSFRIKYLISFYKI